MIYESDYGSAYAPYYSSGWYNTQSIVRTGWTPAGLEEGTSITVSVNAYTEYTDDEGNYVSGDGTSMSIPLVIDNTDPEATAALDSDGDLVVTVSDNRYVAAVLVYARDGNTLYDSYAVNQTESGSDVKTDITISAEDLIAFEQDQGSSIFDVAIVDYAGNESVYRMKLNDEEQYTDTAESIALSESSVVMLNGSAVSLSAIVYPLNVSDDTVTWTSSDESIATVSSHGVITGESVGTATITATSVLTDTVTASCEVEVIEIDVSMYAIWWDENGIVHEAIINSNDVSTYEEVFTMDGEFSSQAIAADGTIYTGTDSSASDPSTTSDIYTLDMETGEVELFQSAVGEFGDMAYGTATNALFGVYQGKLSIVPLDNPEANETRTLSNFSSSSNYMMGIECYETDESGDHFYVITRSGDLYTFVVSPDLVISTPELIGSTGIMSTNNYSRFCSLYYYENVYTDEEYLFFSSFGGGDAPDLYAIVLDDDGYVGGLFDLGTYPTDVWPVSGLMVLSNKSALEQLVDVISDLDGDTYTASTWAALTEALEDAMATLSDGTATQEDVDAAYAALEIAYSALALRGNTNLLAQLVDDLSAAGLSEKNYTAGSWAALNEALDAAKVILADSSDCTQEDVDAALIALTNAWVGLVDTTGLQAVVAAAETLTNQNGTYTSGSWSTFQTALSVAEAVLADTNGTVTAEDVSSAMDTLLNAWKSLVDLSSLQAVVSVVAELDADAYTPASWSALQSALTAANAVLADPNATNQDVADAVSALIDAVSALVKKADTSALAVLVSYASDLNKDDYTDESWTASGIEAALANAQTVLSNANATQDEADAAYAALAEAISALVKKADTSALAVLVSYASDLNKDDYTDESWTASGIEAALANAQTVLSDANATQDEADAAYAALAEAISALVKKADTSALAVLVSYASDLNKDDYTDESWTASGIEAALTNAQTVLSNANATQDEADAAYAALAEAISALEVYVAPEPGEEPGDEPGEEPGDEPGEEPGDEPGEEPDDEIGDAFNDEIDAGAGEGTDAESAEGAESGSDAASESSGAQTGDTSFAVAASILCALALAAVAFLAIRKRRMV